MYDTCVVPTGKLSPGRWDLLRAGGSPELSIAVGSVHVTIPKDVPRGTVVMVVCGQLLITGGVESTSLTTKQMVLIDRLIDKYSSSKFDS